MVVNVNSKVEELEQYMDALRKEGNSIGARINVVATGVPPGLGEPIFDRLDADIAHAMMSINAVKGVELGAGFASVEQKGTEHRDEMTPDGFIGNNAGGVLGGISSGQDIVASIALKPTSSITTPGRSIDVHGQPVEVVTRGRHDPCVGIRAVPIAEAMLAIVLLDHALRQRGQKHGSENGDDGDDDQQFDQRVVRRGLDRPDDRRDHATDCRSDDFHGVPCR